MPLNRRLVLAILVSVIDCGSSYAQRANTTNACVPPAGSLAALNTKDLQFLVIGELHGTKEIPAVFSELVCLAASLGSRVLVGLEFPESARDDFQSYMSSAGLTDDRAKFLNDSGWAQNARRSPDGRTSEAVFGVLDRLRELRDSGLEVSVTTFIRGNEQGNAASLLEAQSDYDLVIVLVVLAPKSSGHARPDFV
jgi:hypothetical protein